MFRIILTSKYQKMVFGDICVYAIRAATPKGDVYYLTLRRRNGTNKVIK